MGGDGVIVGAVGAALLEAARAEVPGALGAVVFEFELVLGTEPQGVDLV